MWFVLLQPTPSANLIINGVDNKELLVQDTVDDFRKEVEFFLSEYGKDSGIDMIRIPNISFVSYKKWHRRRFPPVKAVLFCFLYVILILYNAYTDGVPYLPTHWEPIPLPVPRKPFPVLAEGEKIEFYTGAVFAAGKVFWVIHKEETEYDLASWSLDSGELERISFNSTRIRGTAYDPDADELLVRTQHDILFYNPVELVLIRTVPFEKLDYYWRDMVVCGDTLVSVGLSSDSLLLYDLHTRKLITELAVPRDKIQRIFRCDDESVFLWSSYWGSRLLPFNILTGDAEEEQQARMNHRAFWKGCLIAEGRMGLFDPNTGILDVLGFAGTYWVSLSEGAEVWNQGAAYRFSPVSQSLSGKVTLRTSQSVDPSEIIIVLPPTSTYSQELTDETILNTGQTVWDSFGNRYLRITIPAIEKGQEYSVPFYSAQLTRYQVSFSLSAARQTSEDCPFSSMELPQSTRYYLEDFEYYCVDTPIVTETYRELIGGCSNPAEIVQRIYLFAVEEIKGVWDGRTDDVATVLKNRHGGCTEHTMVQNALLRKAGIPARLVWNWLPTSENPEVSLNHKIAEAYLPCLGWIPMEPLAPPKTLAGTTFGYHLIFAAQSTGRNEFIRNDNLADFIGENASENRRRVNLEVTWALTDIR